MYRPNTVSLECDSLIQLQKNPGLKFVSDVPIYTHTMLFIKSNDNE